MSHLCTMHRPPLSKERTGGDHFGERNSWRVEKTPISPLQSTDNTSASPCTLWWRGGGDTFEERTPSTSLPSFSRRRRSSALIPPQVYVGDTTCRRRIPRSGDLFSGQCGNTVAVSSVEDRITDQRTAFVASPVCSTVGAKSLSALSSHKGCTPKSLIPS